MFATPRPVERRPRRLERGDVVGGVGGFQLQPRQACGARRPLRRAAEFIQVAQGLWDTWEDDAFVLDKAQGLFFDPAKMHMLHHKGEHFSVRGPLMVPRSPQGQPVIVQAGQSDAGRELAARTAEVLFTVAQNLETARAFYADLKARVAQMRPLAGFDQDHAGRADGGRADPGRGAGKIRQASGADPSRARRAGAVGHRRHRPLAVSRSTGRCPTCR